MKEMVCGRNGNCEAARCTKPADPGLLFRSYYSVGTMLIATYTLIIMAH